MREVNFDAKWYHQTIHFVEDAQRVRVYGTDITARKKMGAALQKGYDELEQQVEERTLELRAALSTIISLKDQLDAENIYFRHENKMKHRFENIIGQSDGLKYPPSASAMWTVTATWTAPTLPLFPAAHGL